jgi:hypothetical protein
VQAEKTRGRIAPEFIAQQNKRQGNVEGKLASRLTAARLPIEIDEVARSFPKRAAWLHQVISEERSDKTGFAQGWWIMTERRTNETLDRFASTVSSAIMSSNERLARIEQLVESNNRFLKTFSQDLRQYTDNMGSANSATGSNHIQRQPGLDGI